MDKIGPEEETPKVKDGDMENGSQSIININTEATKQANGTIGKLG